MYLNNLKTESIAHMWDRDTEYHEWLENTVHVLPLSLLRCMQEIIISYVYLTYEPKT